MLAPDPRNPLIVQSDHSIRVEVDNPRYGEARDRLVRFAELVKSPEHIHTYRLTPLSIWNACATGVSTAAIIEALGGLAKYPVPEHVLASVRDFAGCYGRLQMTRDARGLVLTTNDLPPGGRNRAAEGGGPVPARAFRAPPVPGGPGGSRPAQAGAG